ncbi:MAG: flagellar basal body-associated FliL family protein [Myxococcales bacterium]
MAEGEPAPAPPEAKPKPAGGKAGSIILLLLVVVLSVGGSALGSAFGPAIAQKWARDDKSKKEREAEETLGENLALEAMTVDIRDNAGVGHHLRVAVTIELGHPPMPEEEVKKLTPRVRDAVIEDMRGLSYEDLSAASQFTAIRNELQERIGRTLGKHRTKKVFFTEFVLQ